MGLRTPGPDETALMGGYETPAVRTEGGVLQGALTVFQSGEISP